MRSGMGINEMIVGGIGRNRAVTVNVAFFVLN